MKIEDLPTPCRQKTLPDGTVSRIWTSGRRSVRFKMERDMGHLTVFSGKERVMDHFGSVDYAVGYVRAFISAPQPA